MKISPSMSHIVDSRALAKSSFDLWAVGITVVIGGQYFSWNCGLAAGTLSYGIATVLMGLAYICMCFCMAEMSSMVPFAGGAFGLARCTWGFCAGFVVGCCEALQYIMYVACSFVALGNMLGSYQYVVWIGGYILASATLALGGQVYWCWNSLLALMSLGILLIYCVGSMSYIDLARHAGGRDNLVLGGFDQFMFSFPLAAWFYVGVESLNRLCDQVYEPRLTIPRSQVACILTLFMTSIWVFIVCIGLSPGMPALASSAAPLNSGFALIFSVSESTATLFSLPATFATAQGFVQAYSNIIAALSASNLLPSWLAQRHPTTNTPLFAIASGSLLSFTLCVMDDALALDAILFNVSIFFGFVAYISQCAGYIYLKRRYPKMRRTFHSPLGIPGAIYAIVVWSVNIISIAGFQRDKQVSLITGVLIIILCSIYYHTYAKSRQTISDEERKTLFFAHIGT